MRKFIIRSLLILGILILFSGFFWLYETRYLIGRASVSRYTFSAENSYMFVTPLRAKANDQEKIRVTVFVLNNQGLGVLGRKVALDQNPAIKTSIIQGLTDELGKAVFDLTSSQAGDYYLNVVADGVALPQKAHVIFD